MPEIREIYVPEREVQNLKIMDGDVVWKQQEIFLEEFPLLKENEGKGNYTVSFAPIFGENVFYSFNRTRTRCRRDLDAVPVEDGERGHRRNPEICATGQKPKPTPSLDFTNTGVELVTDQPVEGIPSITSEEALKLCWLS